MAIDIQERMKKAMQQAKANDRANVDAVKNVTPGLRVSGSNNTVVSQPSALDTGDYDGVGGFLKGVGQNAFETARSALYNLQALSNSLPVQYSAAPAEGAVQQAREMAAAARAGDESKLSELERQAQERSEKRAADREARISELEQKADESAERAAEIREATVGDSNALVQGAFDVGTGGLQLLGDIALNSVLPGAGAATMFARAAGGAIGEARNEGATTEQQLLYGLGSGALEFATEKISNVAKPLAKMFGKGVADDVVEATIKKLTGTESGRSVLRLLASGVGEGFEEAVSTLVNPVLQRIYDENALEQYSSENGAQLVSDALYDATIGAVLGGLVQLPGSVISSRRSRRASSTANTPGASQNVENNAPAVDSADASFAEGNVTTQPAEAAVEAPTASQAVPEVERILSSGNVSNSAAERIINTPELRAQYEALTGQRLTGTKSEMRNAIKQTAAQMREQASVDSFLNDAAEATGQTVAQKRAASHEVDEILREDRTLGGVTDARADRIIDTPELRAEFERRVGEALPNIRGEARAAIKTYASRTATGPNANTPVTPDSSATVNPTDSLGAAPAGFDRFSAALNRYGEMPERGTGAREMSIPQAMNDSTVVPQTVQSFANAEATPETAYTEITRLIEQGNFDRAVITDQASLARAEETITREGFNRALADWTATVRSGRVSKDTTTLGLTLYNNAINAGDTQAAIQILVDIVDNARTGAQATQAMNILNKLTPEGRLYGVQRSIASLQEEIQRRFGDQAPNIKIDETLASEYLNATDPDAQLEALDNIYKDVARQVPSDWYDKLNAWRYFAMLANPRTHVRNILGNTLMRGVSGLRDRLSGAMQSVFVRDRNKRTRSNLNRTFNVEDEARYNVAYDEYKRVSSMIADAGKYRNELSQIRKYMQPLKGAVGKLANANSALLEWEDMVFSRGAYARSLAQFLKARGITAEQYVNDSISQEVKAKAQAFAIQEAQRATFRDFNEFSDLIQKLANLGGDTGVGRAYRTIVSSVLPFTRTPANILVRGVTEYSPIGIMRGVGNMLTDVRRGNMTAGEAIDQLASGFVGTGIMALGALLAKLGLVTGSGAGDDQEQAMQELTGFQPYALQVDGNSYTLDWLAPAALPFFVGVEVQKLFENSGADDDDLLRALGSITQPMLEMSMLSGVDDLLDSVSYANNSGTSPIWAALASAATSYISQYFPSVFGAIERTTEDQRYTTYTDPNSPIPSDFQYAISRAMNRLPFEYNQVDYIDAWGDTESTGSVFERALENFLSPGYYNESGASHRERELQRIYEETGESVIPERISPNEKYTKKNADGTTEEIHLASEGLYEEYATTLGETQAEGLDELFTTAVYRNMSSQDKARTIKRVEEYAREVARQAIDPDYEMDGVNASAFDAAAQGIEPANYLAYAQNMSQLKSDKDENGDTVPNSLKNKVVSYINSLPLTAAQKDWIYAERGYAASTLDETPWH